MMRHSLQSRKAIDATAAEWVARRDAGLSAVEAAELESWRAADPRHREALLRYESTWSAVARPRQTGALNELGAAIASAARRQQRRRIGSMVAVAAVLLAAGGVWESKRLSEPSEVPPSAIVLQPHRQTLPDGSLLEHPNGSEVTMDFGGGLRRIVLHKGEAHFQVASDPERPFVVEAAGIEIRAVGTAFVVQLGNKVHVLVTEGRVAVDKARITESRSGRRDDTGDALYHQPPSIRPLSSGLTVDAGQRLEIDLAAGASANAAPARPVAVAPAEIAERLAWRNPRIEFSMTPLSEVLAIVNQYNRAQFVIADSSLAAVRLTGVFRADDPETLQRLLETGFGMKAEWRDNEIRLTATGAGTHD